MTVVSVVARCDTSSNEHSQPDAFLGGGGPMNRVLGGVPSHLSDAVSVFCTIQLNTFFARRHYPKFAKGLPFIAGTQASGHVWAEE